MGKTVVANIVNLTSLRSFKISVFSLRHEGDSKDGNATIYCTLKTHSAPTRPCNIATELQSLFEYALYKFYSFHCALVTACLVVMIKANIRTF